MAVVGVGYWGSRILRNLLRSAEPVDVAWVCDLDPDRLVALREQSPGLSFADSLALVLGDPTVDAVLVAVPPRDHLAVGLEVLAAGKHLFIEKPMALGTCEAEQLVAAAERAGRRIMVGLTYLYNDGIVHLGELVSSGALGTVRALYSQRSSHKTSPKHTNVLWSLAPHDVSMLLELVGSAPTHVRAEAGGEGPAADAEEATIDLRFAGELAARVFVSWLAGPKTRRLVVVGERESVVFDECDGRPLLTAYPTPDLADGALDPALLLDLIARIEAGPARVLTAENQVEPLRAECDHFVDCIRHDRAPRTSGAVGLRVTRVLDALQVSLESGGRTVEMS